MGAAPIRRASCAMNDAVPEPVFPEADAYPAYRVPEAVLREKARREPIDEYVLAAVVATGTVIVKHSPRISAQRGGPRHDRVTAGRQLR